MSDITGCRQVSCEYFDKPGPKNTRRVLEMVVQRAGELGIEKVLIPTCSGKTAFEALEVFPSAIRIVAVSHVTGFREPDHQELSQEARERLEASGVKVLTCQHAFGGVGRGVRDKLSTYQLDEIIAYTYRTFGQGTKVAVELALMAADAGLIRTDRDVISTGGTSTGIDTAMVLKPANSFHLFDLRVRELICKPAVF
ncbi:MAG: pyruvate kinase alpha/beta domain-containing protein [Desulfobacteraceae bacterium]